MNKLYYGDNLEILQNNDQYHIPDNSIDLCYIDPPFNSNQNYNQTYSNKEIKDKAQTQAFKDTWIWNDEAIKGLDKFDLTKGKSSPYPEKLINLIKGLETVLYKEYGRVSILAYIVHIAQRIVEIHKKLKPTGSFFLHCDPTASHYIKLLLDCIFIPEGGEFRNEITWKRSKGHSLSKGIDNVTDTIFYYSKSKKVHKEEWMKEISLEEFKTKDHIHYEEETRKWFMDCPLEKSSNAYNKHEKRIIQGKEYSTDLGWVWTQETFDEKLKENPNLIFFTKKGRPKYKIYYDNTYKEKINNLWTDIYPVIPNSKENLYYPTQKPEALLERIIKSTTNEGDVVLDAYCGCGTTVAVAQRLNRQWIGIDISFQSITLIKKRFSIPPFKGVLDNIELGGIPKDIKSAIDLTSKGTNRKEFEMWAILTFNNNAYPRKEHKADGGFDGYIYIRTSSNSKDLKRILFSVKSGKVGVKDIREFIQVIDKNEAVAGIFITVKDPTKDMIIEAKQAGKYTNGLTNYSIDKVQIVTIQEILDKKITQIPDVINNLYNIEGQKKYIKDVQGELFE